MESLRTKVVFFLAYLRPGPFQGAGRVRMGLPGFRQASAGESGGERQVRQASAGCGAVGQGSGGEGPVRQARQVRQACCGTVGQRVFVSMFHLSHLSQGVL